jgi:hypothetical protein
VWRQLEVEPAALTSPRVWRRESRIDFLVFDLDRESKAIMEPYEDVVGVLTELQRRDVTTRSGPTGAGISARPSSRWDLPGCS